MEQGFDSTDRTKQVGWLRGMAVNMCIMGTLYFCATADAIMDYAETDEGEQAWSITWPEWYDAHDRRLLRDMIAANLD